MLTRQRIIRWVFHLLLAVFLANAANKFFVVDLDYELEHDFYGKIFDFEGQAPDQYRILPLLGLKFLTETFSLSFNHAVLLFNFVTGFLCFELLFLLLGSMDFRKRLMLNAVFAGVYIYLQYTGWRPDTMGLLLICLATTFVGMRVEQHTLKWMLLYLLIIAMAFSRTDIAMIYAVFLAFYGGKPRIAGILLPIIPVATQLLLQNWIFPDATYYTKVWMLMDNLSGFYFARNPASWFLLALIIGGWPFIRQFFKRTFSSFKFLYLLLLGYFLLVLVMGRVNEYRLFLPFLPLFIWAWERTVSEYGKETGNI